MKIFHLYRYLVPDTYLWKINGQVTQLLRKEHAWLPSLSPQPVSSFFFFFFSSSSLLFFRPIAFPLSLLLSRTSFIYFAIAYYAALSYRIPHPSRNPTMAHHSKPSLMSRLFPQEDRPTGQLPSTEDSSSSTLFSAEKVPFGSSSSSSFQDETLRRNDLFQACSASFNNATAGDRIQQDKTVEGDFLAPLRRAFVEEGMELHNSVRSKLLKAQQDMSSQISDFEALSSSIASDVDDIYANLSYPLSATLCSAPNFPSATIEIHLANTKDQLKETEKMMRNLQDEWEENVRLEENFRRELASIEKTPGQSDADHSKMASLKEEVEQLVLDNTQALNEIEETYKEEIQAETMKMMQAMLVD
ncbi:hypothetical protein ACSS6W_004352 [Trichoderma asperelloides]